LSATLSAPCSGGTETSCVCCSIILRFMMGFSRSDEIPTHVRCATTSPNASTSGGCISASVILVISVVG
jgi:hypothetical protein